VHWGLGAPLRTNQADEPPFVLLLKWWIVSTAVESPMRHIHVCVWMCVQVCEKVIM